MNCQNCRELMIDYFEADLSSHTRDDIAKHLQQCEHCCRQFDLTRMENQILKDTSDIPAIDPNFNSNIIKLIAAEASSTKTQRRLKWLPVYSKAAVAVALLLVCFYIPGIIPEKLEDNTLQRAVSPTKANSSLTATVPRNIMKAKVAYNGMNTKSTYNDNNNQAAEVSQSSPQVSETPLPSSDQKVMNSSEDSMTAVRSFKAESDVSRSASPETIRLGNIPIGFILQKTEQMSENQVEYSYETQDGTQSLLVKLMLSEPAAQTAVVNNSPTQEEKPMSPIALDNTAALENESMREREFEGKTYKIIVSGNLSQEDINNIANDISLSTEP